MLPSRKEIFPGFQIIKCAYMYMYMAYYENGLNSIIKPSKTYKIFSIIFWVTTTLTLHFLGSCNMYLLATVNFYFILLNGRQVKHPFLFLSQK